MSLIRHKYASEETKKSALEVLEKFNNITKEAKIYFLFEIGITKGVSFSKKDNNKVLIKRAYSRQSITRKLNVMFRKKLRQFNYLQKNEVAKFVAYCISYFKKGKNNYKPKEIRDIILTIATSFFGINEERLKKIITKEKI